MRWSIIRLIWLREMRDQFRDRRTLFMIAGLPLLLYPVLGIAVLQFAFGYTEKPSVIGVVPLEDSSQFPPREPPTAGLSPLPWVSWLRLTTPGVDGAMGALALAQHSHSQLDYPPLARGAQFTTLDQTSPPSLTARLLAKTKLELVTLTDPAQEALDQRTVDVVLRSPPDFYSRLELAEQGQSAPRAHIHVEMRPGDDYSKLALERLRPLLEQWKSDLRRVRLIRKGLDAHFEDPFEIQQPASSAARQETIFDLAVRLFPFMLVMWSLAGALYPAIDLCAGEKERGTMETLLITPAGREEIVLGKFLTIWLFSFASALLNLASMGITTWQFSAMMPHGGLPFAAILWCIVLALPLSALFSAVCLAIGAYARSSKEGQYYLMPLFLVTMPLIFLTLAPGVELNAFYSLVPITGVGLLMQRLMTSSSLDQVPWLYFIPVLLPVGLYSWLALRWAIVQFQREEVLFREAERIDFRLWVRHLLRDKEPTPTTGQAFFCFGLILLLRWLTMGLGRHLSPPAFISVNMLAFVATPALFMTVVLNTRPLESLSLRWPRWRHLGLAAVLALLLLPPLAGLALAAVDRLPQIAQLLDDRQPLVQSLRGLIEGQSPAREFWLPYLFAFAVLPALCEEIVFRGFLLNGLMKSHRPRTAILLSSFLFALFHMNVFQFLPAFFLGVVLGLITVRSKSVVPAMFFHLLHNGILLGSLEIKEWLDAIVPDMAAWWPYLAAGSFIAAVVLLWWLYRQPYVEMARQRRQPDLVDSK
jgi:sodium transport system permease protein